jgi:hypothetical protein
MKGVRSFICLERRVHTPDDGLVMGVQSMHKSMQKNLPGIMGVQHGKG